MEAWRHGGMEVSNRGIEASKHRIFPLQPSNIDPASDSDSDSPTLHARSRTHHARRLARDRLVK